LLHKITSIKGRQILDSRGNPTVEVDMVLDDNEIIGRGVAPSGASTGKLEALELRDHDNDIYDGKSVQKAVDFINGEISDKKIDNLSKGVKINNELSKFSDIVPVKKKSRSKNHWFYVCLFTGKNREVRKLWSSQKLTVNRLIRLRYGPIILPDNMKPEGWKLLSKKEVRKLQNLLKV